MELDNETYERIDRYLSDSMRPEERKAFEQELENNTTLKKEVGLQRDIKSAITEKNWTLRERDELDKEKISEITTYRQTDEFENAKKAIQQASNTYFEKTSKKKSGNWIYYLSGAAAVLLILVVLKFSGNPNPAKLYEAHSDWNDLPSLTVQGSESNQLAKAEALFQEQKYREAITTFRAAEQQLLKENTINPYIFIYMGIGHMEIGDTDTALGYFEKLRQSNTVDSTRAHWYKALLFLKTEKPENARKELEILTKDKDGFKYEASVELLKNLTDY